MNARQFNNTDVIREKISDHYPVVHNGALFWNIMMQGRMRQRQGGEGGYNNGFAMVETDRQYKNRLINVANEIAKIIENNCSIDAISICEGPINEDDVAIFIASLKQHLAMQKFFNEISSDFHAANLKTGNNWGLLLLVDKIYEVRDISETLPKISSKLANRFQLYELSIVNSKKYIAIAHLPFADNENVREKIDLSEDGKQYCDLLKNVITQYENQSFMLCGDFNLNPHLISEINDRALDNIQHHNSIVLKNKEPLTVTVDGILLSKHEKQKGHRYKLNRLGKEHCFFKSAMNDHLEEYRHAHPSIQREYDKRFGLVHF